MTSSYSDIELIRMIRSGGKQMELAMRYWNSHSGIREKLDSWIRKAGGTKADSADIFQDSICYLILNIRNGKFEGASNLQTYFMAIGKNLWLQQSRRSQHYQRILNSVQAEEATVINPEHILMRAEQINRLDQLLQLTGDACRKVLGMWSLNFSMREIARELGYKTEAVVRKKKHQCLKQLMKLTAQNPEWKKGL
ncbi:MAG: sigma-70 family RNA polymerase sigma factor [Bacteroidetes bacterium]|nr:sigma-70 family RNA polymerase sigma factor [Bacteroidota bacterium]